MAFDTASIRSFDVPRTVVALLAIIAASVVVGEILLWLGRIAIRRIRAAADRMRRR